MRTRVPLSFLFIALVAPAAAAEDPPAAEPPAAMEGEFYAEYATESLDADPGVVALSGEIEVRRGDFHLSVPDGGVVLWVDPVKWREFRRSASDFGGGSDGEDGGDGKKEKKEKEGKEGGPTRAADILGPVIRLLYAEGGVTLRRGRETVRAERLFYDFARNRAVILRAEVMYRWREARRGFDTPLIVRAERLYQEAKGELHGGPARVTSSLFADPQYEIVVREVRIRESEEAGYDIGAEGNVLRVGDVPVFWVPGLAANSVTGVDPLKSARFGSSSRFGAYGEVVLGGGIVLSPEPDARPIAEWYLNPVYRHDRGPGLGGGVEYRHPGVRGRLEGFYQYDGAEEDHIKETAVPQNNRGRARWQHGQTFVDDFLGGRLSGIAEVSWLSDRGYLAEYETNEYQQGKAQETVGYLNWAAPSQAASLTGRWQLNHFDTVTEYRPRLAHDLFDIPILTDVLGSGTDLLLSGEAEAANVRRASDPQLDMRGASTDRFGGRAMLSAPFSVGPVRVNPEFGGGATGYHGDQDLQRNESFAALRAGTEFWRVFPEVQSGFLELEGLRHAVGLSAAWIDRFCVTEDSRGIVVQDPYDLVDEVQAADLRLRNRLQTKRDGKIVDFVDFEVRAVYFPGETAARPAPFSAREEWGLGISSLLLTEEEKFRTIERRGLGPVTGDLRLRPREDLTFLANAWYDAETHGFETFSEGVRYEAFPSLSFFAGHRAIRGDSSIITAWTEFRAGDRWEVRLYQQTDLRDEGGLGTGVILRRLFPDFVFELRLGWRSTRNEFSFGFTLEPRFTYEAARERRESQLDMMDYRGMRRLR
jgi:hypothetical protein